MICRNWAKRQGVSSLLYVIQYNTDLSVCERKTELIMNAIKYRIMSLFLSIKL